MEKPPKFKKLKPTAHMFVDDDGSIMDLKKVYKLLVKIRKAKFTTSEARKFKYFLDDYIRNPYNE